MRVLVAIPCYQCAAQVARVLNEFDASLLGRVTEIAVFDNRSPDDTVESAKSAVGELRRRFPAAPPIHVMVNEVNYGLGGTHKTAFLYGEKHGFDYVAILHGDNQAVTRELGDLLDDAGLEPGLDAVLGARFMRQSRLMGYSLIRTLGNRGLNLVYSLLALRRTYDLGSGLNLFKLSTLRDHRFLGFTDGFTFNMDLLLDYYAKGARLKFHPITWREEDQTSNAKAMKVGWITLLTVLKWRLGLKKSSGADSAPKNYICAPR